MVKVRIRNSSLPGHGAPENFQTDVTDICFTQSNSSSASSKLRQSSVSSFSVLSLTAEASTPK